MAFYDSLICPCTFTYFLQKYMSFSEITVFLIDLKGKKGDSENDLL